MHFCSMLKKLQERWKVNLLNLVLILLTFATGGSLCGWAGRKLLLLTSLEKGVVWVISYIILVTVLWPFCVLLISIPLGQFGFFRKYIARIMSAFSARKKKTVGKQPVNIAIFASGAGSNAKKIIEYFNTTEGKSGKVCLVVCNNPAAGVLQIAAAHQIPTLLVTREHFRENSRLPELLEEKDIRFIVLAGFLWKVPAFLVRQFPRRIINIHPALLPKYGGKGMYGHHVHEAVIANKETQSGISIHYVDELYDHGEVIFQATCDVLPADTAETLAKRVHQLEHEHFPTVIEAALQKQNWR